MRQKAVQADQQLSQFANKAEQSKKGSEEAFSQQLSFWKGRATTFENNCSDAKAREIQLVKELETAAKKLELLEQQNKELRSKVLALDADLGTLRVGLEVKLKGEKENLIQELEKSKYHIQGVEQQKERELDMWRKRCQ